MRSTIRRHPVASYLLAAYMIFWASWMPVLFLDAPPRLFSAVGAILGLALPAFLVTAATDGRPGVGDLLRRTLRWRVSIGWYLLAALAIPAGALLLAPLFLGPAPLQGLLSNWPLLFTAFLPQLLLALVTVQFFEELGWSGLVQHRLQARHGALKASLLVALAFAFLHAPTYLRTPISAESLVRDLSVLAIVLPFAIAFRILIAFSYNRAAYAVLIAAITHASFNEASELIGSNVPGPLADPGVRIDRTARHPRRGAQPSDPGLPAPIASGRGRTRRAQQFTPGWGGPTSLSSADPVGHRRLGPDVTTRPRPGSPCRTHRTLGGDMAGKTRIPKAELNGVYGALVKRMSRKMLGQVAEPVEVAWHHRGVVNFGFRLGRESGKWHECDENLKSFAHMAVACLVGCSFCLDLGYFMVHNAGLDEAKAREVPRWRESDIFTPLERDVMAYAEAMSQTPPTVTDEMSARLLDALGAPALVELTTYIALANLYTRSNVALGVESQGLSASCDLKPLAVASTGVTSGSSRG